MGGARRRAGAGFDFASFADVFDDLFGDFMGGGRRRGRGGRAAAPTCATTSRSRSRRRSPASRRRSACRPRCAARSATAPAARPGSEPGGLPELPRRRPGAQPAGLLHGRAHLPDLPGHRAGDQESLRGAAAAAACVQREKTLSVNIPPGVEDGTRIRLSGEGEAGDPRRRSRATSTSSSAWRRTGCSARRRQHLLPGADPDDHGGAGRPDRGADDRGPARCASQSRPAPRPASSSGCKARA